MGYTIIKQRENIMTEEYKNNVILNKSNHSYFVNRKITEKFDINSWVGKRCFIIGGGSSLKNFNFRKLDGELSIGINKSFQIYQNATINYGMDSDFYDAIYDGRYDQHSQEKLLDKWNSFKGIKIFLTPMEFKQFKGDVLLVRRRWEECVNRSDLETGIWGGTNSATGALNLAISLGANPIYLLGYDMQVKEQSHWHSGYPNRNLVEFNAKLGEYRMEITHLHPLIHQLGVKVINLNSDSTLRCFEFGDIDEVLK